MKRNLIIRHTNNLFSNCNINRGIQLESSCNNMMKTLTETYLPNLPIESNSMKSLPFSRYYELEQQGSQPRLQRYLKQWTC